MDKKTLLALDLSTKATGWAIFKDKKLGQYDCITASSSNLFHRIDKMVDEINKVIAEARPTQIVIEDVIPADVHNNIKIYKALTYLQGYILHALDNNKISDIKFYTASEWRSKCGIHTGPGVKRDSLKPKDIAFVKKEYGIDVNDDVADAICIGYAYLHDETQTVEIVDGFEFR